MLVDKRHLINIMTVLTIVGLCLNGLTVLSAVDPSDEVEHDERPASVTKEVSSQYSDFIRITVTTNRTSAIGDVATGNLDVFVQAIEGGVYDNLTTEWKEKLGRWESEESYNNLYFNPAHEPDNSTTPDYKYLCYVNGRLQFNPFAVKKVRYAMNFLVNRRNITQSIYNGHADPRYVWISNSLKVYKDKFKEMIEDEHGLTPTGNKSKGIKMIQEGMEKAQNEIAEGHLRDPANSTTDYWQYQPPSGNWSDVTTVGIIRVEDKRTEIGQYVADLLRDAHIQVEEKLKNMTEAIPLVFYGDYDDLGWGYYTGGWIQDENRYYVEKSCSEKYAPWYGFMPTNSGSDNYQYENQTLDELGQDLYYGEINSKQEYWNKLQAQAEAGLNESVRVFLCTNLKYYVYNETGVEGATTDTITGWSNYFTPRTAEFSDSSFDWGQYSSTEELFVGNWNKYGGSNCIPGNRQRITCHDPGVANHPKTGKPISVRLDWDDKGEVVMDYEWTAGNLTKNITVPSDAVIYDTGNQEWIEVGSGYRSAVKVTYNVTLGKWHDGHDLSIRDIMAMYALDKDMAYNDSVSNDNYESSWSAYGQSYYEDVVGTRWDQENGTFTIWGDHTYPMKDRIANYYSKFPIVPYQIYEAAAQLVEDTSLDPGSPPDYSWQDKTGSNWVNWLNESHGQDFKMVLQNMRDHDWRPPYLNTSNNAPIDISQTDFESQITSIIGFYNETGHFYDSNGPYRIKDYNASQPRLDFERFNESQGYPWSEDYWSHRFSAYEDHEPIRIDNDTDLNQTAQAEGWSGDGSEDDPYVIEGYEIDGGGYGYCIYIGNTTDHFVVRDCYLHNASDDHYEKSGLYLNKVENGKIVGNNISSNYWFGIDLFNSANISIKHNNISANQDAGIYLESSNNSEVRENTIFSNDIGVRLGAYLDSSNFNVVDNNTCYNNSYGIYIDHSTQNIVRDNDVTNGYTGLEAYRSYGNKIIDNTVSSNSFLGMWFSQSYNNTIAYNDMNNNDEGLRFDSSNNNTAYANNISLNFEYGVKIQSDSENNAIYWNNLIDNLINNTFQGYDDGIGNQWYNPITQEGNYWSDYNGTDSDGDGIGETPYTNIAGTAGSQDDYPLTDPFGTGNNSAPGSPIDPDPADGAKDVSTSITLSVNVSDPDGDLMEVSFYDASDDSLIGKDHNVSSGGTATVSWSGLSQGAEYEWYALADDGLYTTQSSIWSFTTFATGITIGEAVDNTNLSWTTGGDSAWFGQNWTGYHDGDSAQSGDILDNQMSYVETTVSGAGNLSFYWNVSSESGFDYLRFYINGSQIDSISGNTSWSYESYTLSSGNHTLRWSYEKDGSVSDYDDCGWIDRVEFTGSANSPPSADFTFSPTDPTVGETVSFTDQSWDTDGNVTSWYWDFGDGTNSTSQDVSHIYGSAGLYNVSLTVTDDDGAMDSIYKYVNVSAGNSAPNPPYYPVPADGATGIDTGPSLSVNVSDPDGDNLEVYFYNASDGNVIGVDYNVSSASTATVSWSGLSPGITYHWYAIAYDGVNATRSSTWSFTTLSNISIGEAVDNTNLSWTTGGDSAWFGQSLTAYYEGDAAQSGDISDGESTYVETTVSSGGNLSFYWRTSSESGYDYLVFYIDEVQQDSISGNTSWSYESYTLSSGNHTLRWSYEKDGSVSDYDDCGWIDRVEFTGSANSPPSADFTFSPTDPTVGETVSFTDQSWDTDGNVTSWYWDFGDGTNSTSQDVSHIYGSAGLYNVSLTVTDDDGATDTRYQVLNVSGGGNSRPDSPFDPVPADGETGVVTSPTLSVGVHDPDGDAMHVSFYDASDSSLIGTDYNVSSGSTASVTWTSLSQGTTYEWYAVADDGINGTQSPSWVFTTMEINSPPDAMFDYAPSNPDVGEPVNFADQSTDSDGNIVWWYWEFGDGSDSTLQNPSHIYDSGGTYTVSLTVEDDEGATDSASFSIKVGDVNTAPKAAFVYTPSTPAVGETIRFIDQSSDPDGEIKSRHWDFGDDSMATGSNLTHSYDEIGTYTVKLTVMDDQGGSDSVTWNIHVYNVPSAPQDLQASGGDGRVTLSWEVPSENGGSIILEYRIYRGTSSGDLRRIDSMSGKVTSYVDTEVTNGRSYHYRVSAVNTAGEGGRSNGVEAAPGEAITLPSAPRDLKGTLNNGRVNLSWVVPLDSGGENVDEYNIYRGNSSGNMTYLCSVDGKFLNHTDGTNLTEGMTYYYQVSAVNSVGEGPLSEEVTATISKDGGKTYDKDGIPAAWETKYGLDPYDPSDAEEDKDGDGYTNLEEYKEDTNPTDASSHPEETGLGWLLYLIPLIIAALVIVAGLMYWRSKSEDKRSKKRPAEEKMRSKDTTGEEETTQGPEDKSQDKKTPPPRPPNPPEDMNEPDMDGSSEITDEF